MGRLAVHRPPGRRLGASGSRHLPVAATLLSLPALAACLGPLNPALLPLALIQPLLPREPCPRLANLDGSQTPEQLYKGVPACLRRSEPDTAVVLFSLAAAYGRFDAMRVADPSAHQAGSLLRLMALQRLDEAQRQTLSQGMAAALSDTGNRPDLCATIERIGPPTYRPDYMLQHGQAGLRRSLSGAGSSPAQAQAALVEEFDGEAAWNQVLDGLLRCSKA